MRRLQQYSVNLYDQDIKKLRDRGDTLPLQAFGDSGGAVCDNQGPYVLQNMRLYDSDCGLIVDGAEDSGLMADGVNDDSSPFVV